MLRWGILVALGLGLGACHEGDGSDIGPKLAKGPSYDYRVLVHDDAARPVVSARVTVSTGRGTTTAHTGRAFLHELHIGPRLVTVDGTNGAAADDSRLGSLTVAATLPDGDELPYVFYLPDHKGSAGLSLTTGVQAGPSTLDDSADSGAVLTINAGENVGAGGAATVELRTGKLSVGHLPSTLTNGGAPLLSSRGIYIHPANATFQNGIGLSIPDDMGLGTGQIVNIYRLDAATGVWILAGTAAESGGRIVAAAPGAAIRSGGLYAFGAAVATTTVVSGRLLDPEKRPLQNQLVRGPQSSTRTNSDGRFTLPAMARTTGAGADRTVTIEFHGGRNWLPVRTATTVTLDAATKDVGDVSHHTRPATNLRLLLINRGDVVKNRRFRVSGRERFSDSEDVIGSDGIANLEEVVAEVNGYVSSVQNNIHSVYRTRSLLFLRPGLDNATSIFSDEFGWRQGFGGGSVIESVDKYGTGSLHLTHVITGDTPGEGHQGQTDLNGLRGIGVPHGTLLTTVAEHELGDDKVVSAFGMLGSNYGRFEMPTERPRRKFAPFRRFGFIDGNLTGVAGSNTRQARASGELTKQEWLDQVLFGRLDSRRAPRTTVPSASSVAFRLGLPTGAGHVAGAEGTTAGGFFTLERLGVQPVTAIEAATVLQDVPLVAANTSFLINNALLGRDANIPATDFGFDLAGDLDSGFVVDLARGVGGPTSVTVTGVDVSLRLPPVPSAVARYFTVFGGENVSGGVTRRQHTVLSMDGQAVPNLGLLGVPTISSPAPGATVSGGGFTTVFALPADCHYGVVQLRSTAVVSGKNETRDWTVVVPQWATAVKFFDLPSQVPDLLVPGRTWTLTVRAGRIGSGLLLDPRLTYEEVQLRILANWVGMGEHERGENAFSSISFQVTTN